MLGFYP
ncbi:hypothetical protein LINPERPRIM_LOCUS5507 [Linum perenne]